MLVLVYVKAMALFFHAVSRTRSVYIDVMSAIKTAITTLVFSAISDAAPTQPEINKIKNKNIRMYHPWSSLTDGGLGAWVY